MKLDGIQKQKNSLRNCKRISLKELLKKVRNVAESGRGIETLKDFKYGFKIRAGDYRALVDIYYNPNIIVVRVVDHRSRVYKR